MRATVEKRIRSATSGGALWLRVSDAWLASSAVVSTRPRRRAAVASQLGEDGGDAWHLPANDSGSPSSPCGCLARRAS
jgi:hypothetical protein